MQILPVFVTSRYPFVLETHLDLAIYFEKANKDLTFSPIEQEEIPTMTLTELLDKKDYEKSQGAWVAANRGSEVPFTTRANYRLLYCYQPSSGRHAYINCDTDMILTDEEAALALGI
jgi:hypothetical protein